MGFSIIAKTAIQKQPAIGINVRTILQPNTYYTCPAGKVAHVVGRVTCTGTGAAATAHFLIDSVIVNRWQVDLINVNTVVQENTYIVVNSAGGRTVTPLNVYVTYDFYLNAGEGISTDQSSGTNAEFNVFLIITESPA